MNASAIATQAVVFTAVALICAAPAGAQPVSTNSSSPEWWAANSPLIVRAVIGNVIAHEHDESGITRYQTVSIRVLETIKGKHAASLEFVQNGDFGGTRLSDLQQSKREVLIFFDRWNRRGFTEASWRYGYTRFPYIVERMAISTPQAVQWAHSGVPLLSNELTPISTLKQLIETVRDDLKKRRDLGPVPDVTFELPARLRGKSYKHYFRVPLDADFEKIEQALGADGEAKAIRDLVRQYLEPAVDYKTFQAKFAKAPPAETPPPYSRTRGGYIGVYSLELMAADCDVIVRGVIEDSCFVTTTADPTGNSYGVRMRVLETLKGKPTKRIRFFVTDARDLEKLQCDQQELVVFLRSNRNQPVADPAGALAFRTRDTLWDDSVIVLNDHDAEVLTADLTWLREPQKILNRLRVVTKRVRPKKQPDNKQDDAEPPISEHGTRPPVFAVYPPATIVAGSSIAGNKYAVIYLPVDRHLQENARKWASAKNKDLRWLAARAIIYFKSDNNAALLKTMLDDDATWERRERLHLIGSLSWKEEPQWLVRWEAWHVLNGWGYEIPKPTFIQTER